MDATAPIAPYMIAFSMALAFTEFEGPAPFYQQNSIIFLHFINSRNSGIAPATAVSRRKI